MMFRPQPTALPQYRPDIDGQRGLAVVCVLLFHLDIAGFAGGFVGVDMFFVVSGFLITALLRRDVEQKSFSFAGFYVRRVRRIVPALAATVLATAFAAWVLLAPLGRPDVLLSAIHAMLGISNITFWSGSGYFDAQAAFKPLLHTWSLGVEEQFYLLWPAILLALLAPRRKWIAPVGILLIGVVSLALANAPWFGRSTVFFLAPFRSWEFAAGALATWIHPGLRRDSLACEVCGVLGLVLTTAAVTLLDVRTVPATLPSMVAAAASVLLLLGGESRYSGRLLRSRGAVALGRVSYSLYLVHWPLISLYRYWTLAPPSMAEKIGLALAALGGAVLLFRVVERPFRYGWKRLPPLAVLTPVAVVYVLLVALLAPARPHWFAEALASDVVMREKDRRFQTIGEVCSRKGWDRCNEPVPGKVNVLVVGDSTAVDGYNAVHVVMPDASLSLSTLAGCPPYDGMGELLAPDFPGRAECIALNRRRFDGDFLAAFDAIVVQSLFGWYRPEHLARFLDRIREVAPSVPVVVLGNYRSLTLECWTIAARIGIAGCGERRFVDSEFLYDAELKSIAERHGADYISMKDTFCSGADCLVQVGTVPFTWDLFHFSYEFSLELGRRLGRDPATQKIRTLMARQQPT